MKKVYEQNPIKSTVLTSSVWKITRIKFNKRLDTKKSSKYHYNIMSINQNLNTLRHVDCSLQYNIYNLQHHMNHYNIITLLLQIFLKVKTEFFHKKYYLKCSDQFEICFNKCSLYGFSEIHLLEDFKTFVDQYLLNKKSTSHFKDFCSSSRAIFTTRLCRHDLTEAHWHSK